MMVYGIYLAHRGPKPLYNPYIPSSDFNLLNAVPKSVGNDLSLEGNEGLLDV